MIFETEPEHERSLSRSVLIIRLISRVPKIGSEGFHVMSYLQNDFGIHHTNHLYIRATIRETTFQLRFCVQVQHLQRPDDLNLVPSK
jgi:hypothetical protein